MSSSGLDWEEKCGASGEGEKGREGCRRRGNVRDVRSDHGRGEQLFPHIFVPDETPALHSRDWHHFCFLHIYMPRTKQGDEEKSYFSANSVVCTASCCF